jgi:hypothetical protein
MMVLVLHKVIDKLINLVLRARQAKQALGVRGDKGQLLDRCSHDERGLTVVQTPLLNLNFL